MDKKETLFSFPIDKFLGLNTDTSVSALKAGESPYMKNFRIADGYSLVKRDGYTRLYDFGPNIRAVFFARLETYCLFVASGEMIYMLPFPFEGSQAYEVGSVGQSDNCFFMKYGGRVYIWGGGKVQKYDEEARQFVDIEPYRPLIAVSCSPYGLDGVPLEGVNMLSGAVRKQFSPSESADRTFRLHGEACASVDYVKYNGRTLDPELYRVTDDNSGLVVDTEAEMQAGTNNVEIGYTLANTEENYGKIVNCSSFMFYGGENDTKVFLWGNPDYPDGRFYSETAEGEPSAEYFPEANFTRIGDGEKICDIVRQYDRQLIFCESSAYVSYIENTVDALGRSGFSFPVRTLSDTVGSSAHGQTRLIDNIPVTITDKGLYKWVSTSQRDERNTHCISERINKELLKGDIKSAKVFDYASRGEEYIYFPDGKVYVYGYKNDVFFMYDNIFAHTFFEDGKGNLYFVGTDGGLCAFGNIPSDDGNPIECVWQSGYSDMGHFGRKNLYDVCITYRRHNNTAFDINWVSDTDTDTYYSSPCIVKCRILDFASLNFNYFSFKTVHSVKNIRHRMRTKRFRYLKLIIKNHSDNNRIHIHRICLNGKNTDC